MNHLSSRIYQDEKDLRTILELTTRVRPPTYLYDYPVQVNMEENFASTAIRANTRLWFDHDQPVAWASVDDFNNLGWEIDKRYEELLGAQIVEWGENCLRKAAANRNEMTLDTSCREEYAERIAFLKQFGFQQTESSTIRMKRNLSQPIPESKLPQGFVLRPIAGIQEAEAVGFRTEYKTIWFSKEVK